MIAAGLTNPLPWILFRQRLKQLLLSPSYTWYRLNHGSLNKFQIRNSRFVIVRTYKPGFNIVIVFWNTIYGRNDNLDVFVKCEQIRWYGPRCCRNLSGYHGRLTIDRPRFGSCVQANGKTYPDLYNLWLIKGATKPFIFDKLVGNWIQWN